MTFKKTMLTFLACGFFFNIYSQNKSDEILTGTGFHKSDSALKKVIYPGLKKRTGDTLQPPTDTFLTLVKKGTSNFGGDNYKGKHLEAARQKFQSGKKYLQQPIALINAQLEYVATVDSSYILNVNPYYEANFLMSSQWAIAGIPVSFSLGNQFFADNLNYQASNFDFKFDKDAYLDQVKKKLGKAMDPSALVNNFEDPLKLVMQQAEQSLGKELSTLSGSYGEILKGDVAGLMHDPSSLFSADMKELRQRYMSNEFVQKVMQNEIMLSALQQKESMGEKVNSEDIQSLKSSVLRMKALQEMLVKIEEHKTKWESSGLIKKIKEFELLKGNKINRLLNDPSFVRKQAKQHLSLKGLQRIFLNVNRLNIGRDALSLSPMSFNHFLQNGISTEFLNSRGKTFMLVAGKQKDINSAIDQVFTGNLFSNNGQVKATRIGLGSSSVSTSHISVSSFEQSMNAGLLTAFNANEFRKILVTTISKQLNIGQKGSIMVDLSRSAASYRQDDTIADTLLTSKNNFSRILSSKNIMDNTALSLSYADENTEKGFSYQFNFSKVTNGYTNPGNSFLAGGSTELGTQLRKYLFKRRMKVSFRGNVRDYKFNDESDNRWRNAFMVFDVKWRMKKGQHVGVRYQPNRMMRIEAGQKNVVTLMDRISVEANLYKKIGRTGYRNYLSMAWQKNIYALSTSENISSSSLQVNSFQNITVGKNLVFANVSYSGANNRSQYVYFNSSLNSDIGYSFQLFKRIMASSGVVYSSVNEWYKQIGIRQSLSGQLHEKFYVNVYVDARKNIELIQPLWHSPVRADISVKYILKK